MTDCLPHPTFYLLLDSRFPCWGMSLRNICLSHIFPNMCAGLKVTELYRKCEIRSKLETQQKGEELYSPTMTDGDINYPALT